MARKISIGHLSTFYHTSFILEGTDRLQRRGIDAEWKLFASGPDIVKAFEKKDIDMGYVGLPPAIIGMGRGLDLKCVAGGHVEGTVMVAQKEYKGFGELGDPGSVLKQFEGRTVGTPPKGSIHDVIGRDLAERYGVDVKIENYAWADYVLQALVDGEIPAAFGTPPLAVAAKRYGGAKIVIPPDRLWPNNPSYGIMVRGELMEEEGLILDLLEEHELASKLIREDPKKAAGIVANLVGTVDEDFILQTYAVSPKYCAALSEEYIASTMSFVGALKDLGYIDRALSEKDIFEPRYIEKVHPGPPHYAT